MPASESDAAATLTAVVEALLEQVRSVDPDRLTRSLAETPQVLDRALTGMVLVGEALSAAMLVADSPAPEPPPRSRRQVIPVRDDDAVTQAPDAAASTRRRT